MITIGGCTVKTSAYTKHAPMIYLRDIRPEEEDNCFVVVYLSLSSDCDLFRETRGWHSLKSVFILQIRRSAHVIKDGADLFVADQVGIVRVP